MRPGFRKALGKVTSATDSVVDARLKEMAAAKAPPPEPEMEGSEGMEAEAEVDLTPEELAKLKAMLAKE